MVNMQIRGADMGLYAFVGFRLWAMLKVVLNMLASNASPRGIMCFRCLMFSLLFAFQSCSSQSSTPASR